MRQEAVGQYASSTMAALYDLLAQVAVRIKAGRGNWYQAQAIMAAIQELQVQAALVNKVVGMMAPWLPELQKNPQGKQGKPIDLALFTLPKFKFPSLTAAFDFLRKKRLVRWDELDRIAKAERSKIIAVEGVNSVKKLNQLRAAIVESARQGESPHNFRKRLKPVIELGKREAETILRTQTKQAYVAGLEKVLDDPDVKDEFGYVEYVATLDPRTRPAHLSMDGFVCARNDPAYRVLRFLLDEYNCRCSIIPLTKKQAERKGIKTYKDIPTSVLAHCRQHGLAV